MVNRNLISALVWYIVNNKTGKSKENGYFECKNGVRVGRNLRRRGGGDGEDGPAIF